MKTILVPVDFSETSDNALEYALGLANYLTANIILLHVDALPLVNNEFQDLSAAVQKSKEAYVELLSKKADAIKIDHPTRNVDYYYEVGNFQSIVNSLVFEKAIDIIVMGISGHGKKLSKVILGSNAVNLSRECEVPVIIVPPHYKYRRIKNIAYASQYDESVKETTGLIKVKHLNTLFDSTLNVLHVLPDNHMINQSEAETDLYIEQKLENTKHRTYNLWAAKASEALLEFINNHDIDAVIVEQKKHSIFYKIFHQSTTNELAFNSPIPVLSIKG